MVELEGGEAELPVPPRHGCPPAWGLRGQLGVCGGVRRFGGGGSGLVPGSGVSRG